MKSQTLCLFIVDLDLQKMNGLRNYFYKTFGDYISVSTFGNCENAIAKIDAKTKMVILDDSLKADKGNEVRKAIKSRNPDTEVIMLTTFDDIGAKVESIRKGTADQMIKEKGQTWLKIYGLVSDTLRHRVKRLLRN